MEHRGYLLIAHHMCEITSEPRQLRRGDVEVRCSDLFLPNTRYFIFEVILGDLLNYLHLFPRPILICNYKLFHRIPARY